MLDEIDALVDPDGIPDMLREAFEDNDYTLRTLTLDDSVLSTGGDDKTLCYGYAEATVVSDDDYEYRWLIRFQINCGTSADEGYVFDPLEVIIEKPKDMPRRVDDD